MLHLEFAIAPTEIKTINDLQLLDARLGFDKGAVLSVFPKGWFREVNEYLSSAYHGVNLDRALTLVLSLKNKKTASFLRHYEGTSWNEAAVESHGSDSFHRLVEESFDDRPIFLPSTDELGDEDFDFNSRYPRDAISLSKAATALLIGAEKVTIYDPFICITKPGYRKTLLALMNLCKKQDVEFHIFSEEDGKPDWSDTEQALRDFKLSFPNNIKLYWYCVTDHGSGFLHSRGLFTAKGGLVYDRGFEEPNAREQRAELTDVTPMPISMLSGKSETYNTSLSYDDFELVRDVWTSHN